MARRCLVVRGLSKEVEEEINKFLELEPGPILHVTQSEAGEYLSVTILYEVPEHSD